MNKFYLIFPLVLLLIFAGCGDEDPKPLPGRPANPNRSSPGKYIQGALSIPSVLDDQYLLTTAPWAFSVSSLSYLWSHLDLGVFPQYAGLTLPPDELIVAVIDTGIDKDHEDLAGRLWVNPVEGSDGLFDNGVDDDHDGYSDDYLGWDFTNGTNNPADDSGHGTHVAGTIAAIGGNGKGIVGVAPWVRVMALKVCGASGMCDSADIRAAINYAVSHGAKIINLSLGMSDQGSESQAFEQAIAAATAAGTLVFAAAGNSAVDASEITPANATYAMAVAAHRNDGQGCSFSDTGWKVDFSAPGCGYNGAFEVSGILSLNSRKCGLSGDQYCAIRNSVGQAYSLKNGTSMSTPHAVGMAAVAWTASPTATPLQIRQALMRTARKTQAGAVNESVGMGRLSGTNLIEEARTAPGIKISSPRYGTAAASHVIAFRIEARDLPVSWKLRYVADTGVADIDLSQGVPIAESASPVGSGDWLNLSESWTPPSAGNYLVILEAEAGGQKYYDVNLLRR